MTTELRPIPEFENLLASDDGHIFRRYPDGRVRKLRATKRADGYSLVNAKKDGKWCPRYVHRLVAAAWHEAPAGPEVVTRHLDGNRQNNGYQNLRLGTQAQNVSDAVQSGRVRRGEAHPNARLTLADVAAIKHALAMGVSYNTIAVHWQVHKATVADIAQGRTWKDVAPPAEAASPVVPTPDLPSDPPPLAV